MSKKKTVIKVKKVDPKTLKRLDAISKRYQKLTGYTHTRAELIKYAIEKYVNIIETNLEILERINRYKIG